MCSGKYKNNDHKYKRTNVPIALTLKRTFSKCVQNVFVKLSTDQAEAHVS